MFAIKENVFVIAVNKDKKCLGIILHYWQYCHTATPKLKQTQCGEKTYMSVTYTKENRPAERFGSHFSQINFNLAFLPYFLRHILATSHMVI